MSPFGTYGGRYHRTIAPVKEYLYNTNSVRFVQGASELPSEASARMHDLLKSVNVDALIQEACANSLPSLDALTTMVEANKTADMFVKARANAANLVRQARKGGFHTIQAAANARLEWRYGWQTLFMDIESAVESYNHPKIVMIKGQARDERSETVDWIGTYQGYYVTHDLHETYQRNAGINCRFAGQLKTESLNLLVSPTMTLWETVPYSFVADWFVTVGDALAAWQAVSMCKTWTASLGYGYEEESRLVVENVRAGTGAYAKDPHASGGATVKCTLKYRRPITRIPFTPQIRVKLTSARIIDAAALLARPFIKIARRL